MLIGWQAPPLLHKYLPIALGQPSKEFWIPFPYKHNTYLSNLNVFSGHEKLSQIDNLPDRLNNSPLPIILTPCKIMLFVKMDLQQGNYFLSQLMGLILQSSSFLSQSTMIC